MRQAFTLIELLVVVLIIGILAAIALPQYQKAVMKTRAMQGLIQLQAIDTAQEEYYLANGAFSTDIESLSISFANMQSAFIGGTGDFVSLFEPNATQVEKEGYGYIVASLGELGGVIPYTSYSAKTSFINNNKDTHEKM